jgi:tetratricopeptide (TPR) repeat protein
MLRRLVLAAAIAAVLLSPARTLLADDVGEHATDARERSRAAFRKGVSQAQEGNYAGARNSFVEAYRIFPHPSILLNLGIARAHTGEWLEAEQDLVRFLADDGGAQPGELASARAELAQARSHLGTFRLRISPDGAHATLDAKPIALISGGVVDVRTTRGSHDLVVESEGYAAIDRQILVSTERAPDVDITLRSTRGEGAHTPSGEAQRTAGWFLLGGAAVAIAIGAYAGLEAKSLADGYNTVGSGSYQDASTKARGLVFRTSADVAFLCALGLAGTGVYFLLTAPTAPVGVQAVVGPGSAGLAATF